VCRNSTWAACLLGAPPACCQRRQGQPPLAPDHFQRSHSACMLHDACISSDMCRTGHTSGRAHTCDVLAALHPLPSTLKCHTKCQITPRGTPSDYATVLVGWPTTSVGALPSQLAGASHSEYGAEPCLPRRHCRRTCRPARKVSEASAAYNTAASVLLGYKPCSGRRIAFKLCCSCTENGARCLAAVMMPAVWRPEPATVAYQPGHPQ
jgi:hypothetical protein